MKDRYDVDILEITGNTLKIAIRDDIELNNVFTFRGTKKLTGSLIINDNRQISNEQRKLIYALINDLCDYTGDPPDYWKDRFKFEVEGIFNVKPFSLANCSVILGNYMILTILNFLFEENIPFKRKHWYSLPDEFPRQMLCLKNKTCVICGKPHADIAHFKAVGMGRNRQEISHVGMYIMTLCRECHQRQHKQGINEFMKENHIKPIKVTEEIARKYRLGVLSNGNK